MGHDEPVDDELIDDVAVDDEQVEVVPLPDGRRLEIRPTSAADAERLATFFAELSEEDRYRRFFSGFRPDVEFCRTWATVAERGGFGVLAVVHGSASPDDGDDDEHGDGDGGRGGGDGDGGRGGGDGDGGRGDGDGEDGDGADGGGEVVGEAAYAVRDDGDGDLAVTVARAWRGWLGSYLVDVLCRHAAAQGITGLQADVLLENRAMIGLLRHRGAVALEHPDGTIRVTIGTGRDVPSWPPDESRRRVLVEVAGGRWAGEPAATESGIATALCSGPGRRGDRRCPVLDGGRCPLADGADAIVVLLDPADEDSHRLVEAHRRQHPGTPVLVRAGLDADGTCRTVEPTGDETVERILSLVGRRPPEAGGEAT